MEEHTKLKGRASDHSALAGRRRNTFQHAQIIQMEKAQPPNWFGMVAVQDGARTIRLPLGLYRGGRGLGRVSRGVSGRVGATPIGTVRAVGAVGGRVSAVGAVGAISAVAWGVAGGVGAGVWLRGVGPPGLLEGTHVLELRHHQACVAASGGLVLLASVGQPAVGLATCGTWAGSRWMSISLAAQRGARGGASRAVGASGAQARRSSCSGAASEGTTNGG